MREFVGAVAGLWPTMTEAALQRLFMQATCGPWPHYMLAPLL